MASARADSGSPDPSVVVVGAGWAGLAAALRMAQAGLPVTVLEAAPQAGGRARAVALTLAGQSLALDNGQHLMVGAYRECLAVAESAGMADGALVRHPMHLQSVDGLALRSVGLPAPWHLALALLRARGLTWTERWALLRLLGGNRDAVARRLLAQTGDRVRGRWRWEVKEVARALGMRDEDVSAIGRPGGTRSAA